MDASRSMSCKYVPTCKRLTVVGALLSSGELFATKLRETMTAMFFVGFFSLLIEHVGKPLVVIIDDA